MDQQEFDRILGELQGKYPLQPAPVGEFSKTNLKHFCNDLSEFINIYLDRFREKFGFFYNEIRCTITGDKLNVVSIEIDDDCPALLDYFDQLDPPASIRLSFSLTNSRVQKWGNIYKDIFIYFRVDDFEIRYDVPASQPMTNIKVYGSNLYDIVESYLAQLQGDFLLSMSNRDAKN